MKRAFGRGRIFFTTLGLVEQSQVVASTAVIVAMGTIVAAHFATGRQLAWLDFLSVVTVGVIGFVSVFFTLKYGRMLEEQRRHLLELNTIAEAVNHSVELDTVLRSSLSKVMELMNANCGWIYLTDNQTLALRQHNGTQVEVFPADPSLTDEYILWIFKPGMIRMDHPYIIQSTTGEFRSEGNLVLASIPLVRQGIFAGVMIIAGKDGREFQSKKIDLIQAFGNQISVALNNASLFEQVRQSEQQYADLYEHSPDMYHSVNAQGMIVSCNVTESSMLGYTKEEIIGKPLLNLYPPSQHDHVRENLRRIFHLGQELKGVEEQIQRKDGIPIDVSVSTSLIHDAEGNPKTVRMVLRDITEKKLIEEKILQVQKIDSIGNLAGGIAHDFNNILTAILGSASIMRRKVKDDPKWMKYVDLIETTSRRGAAITRQLLTFARKDIPHVHMVDVNAIIDQTLRLYEATTPKSIHIKSVLTEEPVVVQADEGQLQQALLNLCINSRDAMPSGGVLVINTKAVHVGAEQSTYLTEGKPGDYVMISVADSGIGIPASIINRIFEPLFTTKEQGKGTGLGLSVVYGVVRNHNGYINVSSEVNSGTVFTTYLPRVMEANILEPVQAKMAELVGGDECILLVEDEVSIGEIGSDILKELGYTILIARNGRDAVQTLAETDRRIDLVILDMNMPRMGGRETFDQIKELFPELKILVCSGYSASMLDDGKFAKSIDGFIQKPYELEDIVQKIRMILDSPVKVLAPEE